MNWKLEWKWETPNVYGSTYNFYGGAHKYFKNEDEAREFIETLKSNPNCKITSMTLTHTIIII